MPDSFCYSPKCPPAERRHWRPASPSARYCCLGVRAELLWPARTLVPCQGTPGQLTLSCCCIVVLKTAAYFSSGWKAVFTRTAATSSLHKAYWEIQCNKVCRVTRFALGVTARNSRGIDASFMLFWEQPIIDRQSIVTAYSSAVFYDEDTV